MNEDQERKLAEHFIVQLRLLRDEDMGVEDKVSTLGPLLFIFERILTEKRFREILREVVGDLLNDPEVERDCRDFFNLSHFSGVITITLLEEDTWLDSDADVSMLGLTDADIAALLKELEQDKDMWLSMLL